MNIKIFIIAVLFLPKTSHADFIATGEFTGTVCKGIGIELCSKVKIAAIGKNGNLYELKKQYKTVDEFSGKTCHIKTKLDGFGIFSGVASSYKFPDFYTYENNKYEKVSIDYMTFKCKKI